jgi:hypothetical protein
VKVFDRKERKDNLAKIAKHIQLGRIDDTFPGGVIKIK